MLAGIYYGAQYGGSTTAILVNLPGETAAVVTCIDGYQMARQGRAGPALGIAAIGSFFAGTVCTMIIALFGPPLAEMALKFGAPEYFSLMLMGLVTAAVLAHGDMIKSLAMVALGLLLGVVGTDVNSGMARYSFGIPELTDGIGFIVIAVGVFAIGGDHRQSRRPGRAHDLHRPEDHGLWPTLHGSEDIGLDPSCAARRSARSSACCPGPVPRSPRSRPTWSRRSSPKDPSRFGKGAIEGVAGPESANNADAQCKFIPTLTLGHPRERGDGAHARRADHPGHRARAAGDDAEAGPLLGPHRQHVDRQRDARHPEPAADRAVGEPAESALPRCCSRRSWRSRASASTA